MIFQKVLFEKVPNLKISCYKEEWGKKEEESESNSYRIDEAFKEILDSDPSEIAKNIELFKNLLEFVEKCNRKQWYKPSQELIDFLSERLSEENVEIQIISLKILFHFLEWDAIKGKEKLFPILMEMINNLDIGKLGQNYEVYVSSIIECLSFFPCKCLDRYNFIQYFDEKFLGYLMKCMFAFGEISDENLHRKIHISLCKLIYRIIDNYDFTFKHAFVYKKLVFLFDGIDEESSDYLSQCIGTLFEYDYSSSKKGDVKKECIDLFIKAFLASEKAENNLLDTLKNLQPYNMTIMENEKIAKRLVEIITDESMEESNNIILVLESIMNFLNTDGEKCMRAYFNFDDINIIERIISLVCSGSFNVKITASILVFRIMEKIPSFWSRIFEETFLLQDLVASVCETFKSSTSSKHSLTFRYNFYSGLTSLISYFNTIGLNEEILSLLADNELTEILSEEEETNDELQDCLKEITSLFPDNESD